MVVPLLAGDPRKYAAFVMFKGKVTLAAAATGKENTRGGGEGGRAKLHVEMRESYCVSRVIVISSREKNNLLTRETPLNIPSSTGLAPAASTGGCFDQSDVLFQTLAALWELAASCGYSKSGHFLRLEISLIDDHE